MKSMFTKGSTPWNKGLKGTQKANSGSFRKGERRSPETEFKKGTPKHLHPRWKGGKPFCEQCGIEITRGAKLCNAHANVGKNKGKKRPKLAGKNSHLWKGGITPMNQTIRSSVEYKKWREAVFERDKHACVWCGDSSGGNLQADHIKPFAYFPELRFDINNGRTLCERCHKFTATYLERAKYWYEKKPDVFVPKSSRISYGGALIGPEEIDAVMSIILSQGGRRWTVGPESIAFERELAENTGVKRAVVVNSGSSALLVALTALKLPKNSLVAIPAVNFPTAFNAILQCGLTPYVVDVDPKTLLMDLDELEKNKYIKAVIAVNIASNPVDTREIKRRMGDDVKIILDNCDGYGTLIDGKYVDTYADASCVSFHAAHIITTGEGGAVLTDDEEYADTVLKLREWGRATGTDELYDYPGLPEDYRSRYVYEEIGYNMKPLELQCAMGRVQLKKIDWMRERRIENFNLLYEKLSKYSDLQLMEFDKNADVCWFSFPLMCRGVKRKVLMDHLEANNIECRTIFSGNVLRHPAYKDYVDKCVTSNDLHNADDVMANGMFLSVHPSITPEMIEFIDKCVGEVCK